MSMSEATSTPPAGSATRGTVAAQGQGPRGTGQIRTWGEGNFWREAYIVFRRQLRMNLRNPAWVIIGLMQPVLYLLLFAPLLEPLAGQIGYANAYTFFVPGLLVQLGIFGALFAGFSIIAEWREGVIEAERVTPANRTALLVGRLMRDVLQIFVQACVLVALGFVMGLHAPLRGAVLGVVITLGVGAACAAASNALALTTKSEDVMAPLTNMVMMPILLLSGIFLPMNISAQWLNTLSQWIPTRHIVDAVRTSFVGDFDGSSLLFGTLWTVGLLAVAVWWGTATFRKENA